MNLLYREFQTISVDLPGHGNSPAHPDGFDIDRAARQLRLLLHALNVESACIAGLSIGGLVAQRLREIDPALVWGLVLCGTNDLDTPPELAAVMRDFAGRVERDGLDNFGQFLATRWFGPASRSSDVAQYGEYRAMLRHGNPAVIAAGFASVATSRARQPGRLASCPALILVAEFDPPTSIEAAQGLALRFRTSAMRMIDGAFHASPIQQPERVADAIRSFARAWATNIGGAP